MDAGPPTPPVLSVAPAIAGFPQVGQTLLAGGTWTSGLPISYAYTWESCGADGGGCSTVLTGDALLADRSLCQAIVDSGRDYLVRVKKTNRISTKHASSSLPTPRACPTTRDR